MFAEAVLWTCWRRFPPARDYTAKTLSDHEFPQDDSPNAMFFIRDRAHRGSRRSGLAQNPNVFLIVSDGFRWQEVFNGAEPDLMNKHYGGVADPDALEAHFLRETLDARREALACHFSGPKSPSTDNCAVIGPRAVLPPPRTARSFRTPVTMRCFGLRCPRIDSNDKRPNANKTVFEWLNERSRMRRRLLVVLVFGTWDVFPYVFNVGRSRLIWPAGKHSSEYRKSSQHTPPASRTRRFTGFTSRPTSFMCAWPGMQSG